MAAAPAIDSVEFISFRVIAVLSHPPTPVCSKQSHSRSMPHRHGSCSSAGAFLKAYSRPRIGPLYACWPRRWTGLTIYIHTYLLVPVRLRSTDENTNVSPVIRKPFTPLLLWQAYYSTTGQPPCGILNQRDNIFAHVVRSPGLERESGRWASYGGFSMREFVQCQILTCNPDGLSYSNAKVTRSSPYNISPYASCFLETPQL